MSTSSLEAAEVKMNARGHWIRLLSDLGGLDVAILDGRHHPCPKCGGEDRFSLVDADRGALLCRHCFAEKNGDGLAALEWLTGRSFREVLEMVAEEIGMNINSTPKVPDTTPNPVRTPEVGEFDPFRKMVMCRATVEESQAALVEHPAAWQGLLEAKAGVTSESVIATNAFPVKWPRNAGDQETCIAIPFFRSPHDEEPFSYCLMRADGKSLKERGKLPERGKHSITPKGKDSWCWGGDVEQLLNATTIWKCEGPTDLLALLPHLPEGHAAITNLFGAKSGFKQADLSFFGGKTVHIVHDTDDAGQAGAEKVIQSLVDHAGEVRNVVLPKVDNVQPNDLREYLKQGGTFDGLVKSASKAEVHKSKPPWERPVSNAPEEPDEEFDPYDLPTSKSDDDNRIQVILTLDEDEVNQKAAYAIGMDEKVYQRGGLLVHLVIDSSAPSDKYLKRPGPTPRIVPIQRPLLRSILTRVCYFEKVTSGEEGPELKQCSPPGGCASAVLEMKSWPTTSHLSGVVTSPALRPDGTVIDEAGYDKDTGYVFAPNTTLEPVSEIPADAEVHEAVETLTELLTDFPFRTPEHRAAWIACLLTCFARPAFSGPAPLFLIDANVRGSGKSLLSDLIGIITSGHALPRMTSPHSDEEFEKRITALAISGDPIVLIDNIAGSFGCASLDAALTSDHWKGRVLGKSETVSLDYAPVWIATGNNVILGADTSRRVCHIQLLSPEENPEDRGGFRYPDIKRHVREHRGKYVKAALTILRGFCAHNRPDQGLKPWGSFEGWSDLIREAIVWSGLPDPGTTRIELRETADTEADAIRALINGMEIIDPGRRGMSCSEILKACRLDEDDERLQPMRDAIETLCPTRRNEVGARALTRALNRIHRRVIGGKALESDSYGGTKRWFVVDAGVLDLWEPQADTDSPLPPETQNLLDDETADRILSAFDD